jgi:hypothetical protein
MRVASRRGLDLGASLGRQQLKLVLGQIRRRCIERPNAGGCHAAKAGVKKQLRRIALANRKGLHTSLNIVFFQKGRRKAAFSLARARPTRGARAPSEAQQSVAPYRG